MKQAHLSNGTGAPPLRRNKLTIPLSDDECAALGMLCRRFRRFSPVVLARHILRRQLVASPCRVELAGFDPAESLARWVQTCHSAADAREPLPERDGSLDLALGAQAAPRRAVNEVKAKAILTRIFPRLRHLPLDDIAEVFDAIRESTREP